MTQPNDEQFPLDWTAPQKHHSYLGRAIFIASHYELHNEKLTQSLIERQIRFQ